MGKEQLYVHAVDLRRGDRIMQDGVPKAHVMRVQSSKERVVVEIIIDGAAKTCRWKPEDWIEIKEEE